MNPDDICPMSDNDIRDTYQRLCREYAAQVASSPRDSDEPLIPADGAAYLESWFAKEVGQ